MSEPLESFVDELKQYFEVCDEINKVVRRENQALRSADPKTVYEFQESRKELLERLTGAQMRLGVLKTSWLRVPASTRAQRPDIGTLIRQTLDLIMKTIVLDRENEQLLLRHRMYKDSRNS
jgi:flagellar biosynthesis/type III secretory pathway chaperone